MNDTPSPTPATTDDAGFDSPGTIYPHPALVLVPDAADALGQTGERQG